MADRGPQKVGTYERPARAKGLIIGAWCSLPSSFWPLSFFRVGVGKPPRSMREMGMPSVNSGVVRGQDGWCGTVIPRAATCSDPTHVRVQLESGGSASCPRP